MEEYTKATYTAHVPNGLVEQRHHLTHGRGVVLERIGVHVDHGVVETELHAHAHNLINPSTPH